MRHCNRNNTGKLVTGFCLIILCFHHSCIQQNASKSGKEHVEPGYTSQAYKITYFFPASLDSFQQKLLTAKCEAAMDTVLKLLQAGAFTEAINIQFVKDRKEMQQYTGRGAAGMAFPEKKTLYCLANVNEAPVVHELLHLMAMLKWGNPHETSTWMNEGFATFAENNCNNYRVEQIYRFFMSKKMLLSIDSMSANFYGQPEMVAYHQSACIVQFLLNHYSINKFIELWKTGFVHFQEIYHFPFSKILAGINETALVHYPEAPLINWEIFKKGCN
jgi:Peptidase MA superfamily